MCFWKKTTFEDWIKNSEKDIEEAMKEHKTSKVIGSNMGVPLLFSYYIQYMMWKSNRLLVLATWGLAMATILLSILTLFLK